MKNIFLKVVFCCSLCVFLNVEAQITPEEFIEMEKADQVPSFITKIFSKKMYAEKGLVTIGTGGGAAKGSSKGLTTLSVTMHCYQKVNIQQARNLLLECVDEYVIEINKHKEFKQYAYSFPFDVKNIEISLLFVDKMKQDCYLPPYIATAHADERELSYCLSPDSDGPLQRVLTETYEEACALVRGKQTH